MIPTWRERLMIIDHRNSKEIQAAMQAEIDDYKAALATARADERERCAKVADQYPLSAIDGRNMAQAIRALKDAP